MTNCDYDSLEDAADAILGASKDLAAAEDFHNEIPDSQEVDDGKGHSSNNIEGLAAPDTETMYNIADALNILSSTYILFLPDA